MNCNRSHPWNCALLLAVLLTFAGWASAQSPVERAARLAQSGSWSAAYEALAPAIQGEPYRSDAHAWFVMGFIQKELHKLSGETGTDAPYRLGAVGSFQRAMAMSTLTAADRETSREALDYLARSYFREAIDRVEGFTPGATPEILALMGRYESILLQLNAAFDVSDQRADLHRYLGQAHANLLETGRYEATPVEAELFDATVEHYRKSLEYDAASYPSQYNLAIALYNHGVRQLKRINHTTSMFELMEIQDACVGLFEAALEPMQQAHAQRPDRLETLKGLMTIHYALSQEAASAEYREQIERILEKR